LWPAPAEDRLCAKSRRRAALAQTESVLQGRIGDLVVIEGHRVGQGRRTGEILEVFGERGHGHYRVRWEAGNETVFFPSNDATIQRADRRKKRKS
jgi:hypothetical protein